VNKFADKNEKEIFREKRKKKEIKRKIVNPNFSLFMLSSYLF